MRNPPWSRPVSALLATELTCMVAWALTGSVWCCMGAVLSGVALVSVVLFGRE